MTYTFRLLSEQMLYTFDVIWSTKYTLRPVPSSKHTQFSSDFTAAFSLIEEASSMIIQIVTKRDIRCSSRSFFTDAVSNIVNYLTLFTTAQFVIVSMVYTK